MSEADDRQEDPELSQALARLRQEHADAQFERRLALKHFLQKPLAELAQAEAVVAELERRSEVVTHKLNAPPKKTISDLVEAHSLLMGLAVGLFPFAVLSPSAGAMVLALSAAGGGLGFLIAHGGPKE